MAYPVIFDNDASADDAVALMLLAINPSMSVKAVTLACTGEGRGLKAAQNMSAILKLCQLEPAEIAYGEDKPLSTNFIPFPDWLRNAMDTLLEGTLLNRDVGALIGKDPVATMKKVLDESHEKVTIVATGPLTNLANLLIKHPECKNQIKKIVFMGGAYNVKGNIVDLHPNTDNFVAECNVAADPQAAQIVFSSGVSIVSVPLDATQQVPLTKAYYEALKNSTVPEEKLTYQMIEKIVVHVKGGLDEFLKIYFLWDPLAAMICDKEDLAQYTRAQVTINPKTFKTESTSNPLVDSCNVSIALKINNANTILDELRKGLQKRAPQPILNITSTKESCEASAPTDNGKIEKSKQAKLEISLLNKKKHLQIHN